MAAGLQVFGQPASTDVARVLTCLFEKDLEFELVRIDTFKKEHKLPEFIKLRVRLPAISVHSALCYLNWVQNFSIVAWLCRILRGR
jgi:glutathione S-transferase